MSIADPRVRKQAQVLVDYSVKAKKGDKVLVLSDFLGKPLVAEIYKLLVNRGVGEILLRFDSYELEEIYFKNSTPAQRKIFPALEMNEIKGVDCWIGIRCSTNKRGLTGIDASVISKREKVV